MSATLRHPSDAELIRALDRESERALRHVRQCDSCSHRLKRLERQFRAVSRHLGTVDEPVVFTPVSPARANVRTNDRVWLRAAMFTLLLTGGGAMAWATYRMAVSRPETAAAPEALSAPAAVTPAPTASVSFVPVAASLTVRVTAQQPSGVLHITRHGSDSVAVSAASDIPLRVSELGVDIMNNAGARGDYRVAVPASIRSVLVVIGSDTVRLSNEMVQRGELLPLTAAAPGGR